MSFNSPLHITNSISNNAIIPFFCCRFCYFIIICLLLVKIPNMEKSKKLALSLLAELRMKHFL